MHCSACNVESGPTLFCHVCDNYLPNTLTGLKAGLVRRFVAVIVDHVLALTILILSFHWLISASGKTTSSAQTIVILISCLALLAYTVSFFSALALGMTPGKWILGIRAVDKRNGQAPGLGRMLVRELIGKPVSGLFAGLGFFWAIWDRDSQAWHDKLAGTVVVCNDSTLSPELSTVWPAAACVAFFAVFGLQMFSLIEPSWTSTPEKTGTSEERRRPLQFSEAETPAVSAPIKIESELAVEEAVAKTDDNTLDSHATELGPQETEVQSQISAMLTQWAAATEANDPSASSGYYADNVNRYFLARNISRFDILQDKKALLEKGTRFVSYQVEQLKFDQISSNSANVSLVKSYQVINPDMTSMGTKVHSRLWVEDTDAGWKIVGEQDLLK
jgi:uncharacterized RDD family membrane protein YckC